MNCEYCNEKIEKYGYKIDNKYYCQECIDEMTILDICEEFSVHPCDILEMLGIETVDVEEEEISEAEDFAYRQFVEDKMTEENYE